MRKTITRLADVDKRTGEKPRKQTRVLGGNTPKLRHRCRNPRCRQKLPQPVENERNAFCCRGCFDGFYRVICVVCAKPRKPSRQENHAPVCSDKCRRIYHANRAQFASPWGGQRASQNAADGPNIGSGLLLENSPDISRAKTAIASPSSMLWPSVAGRGSAWTEGIESHELRDRDSRIVARLVEDGQGWLLVKPVMFPERPAEPDLDRAKTLAVVAALAALPLAERTIESLRRVNRIERAPPNPDAVFQRDTPISCEADCRAPREVAAIERFDTCGWKREVSSDSVEYLIAVPHTESPARDRTTDVIPIATRLKRPNLPAWSGRDDAGNLDIPEFLRRTETPPQITQAA
jgi:hypothetical protein